MKSCGAGNGNRTRATLTIAAPSARFAMPANYGPTKICVDTFDGAQRSFSQGRANLTCCILEVGHVASLFLPRIASGADGI